MSHVDEGTLHAYLDGELPRVEAEGVRVHLARCTACQGRLEEERALVERANRLLERAAPPLSGRVVPTLESLSPRVRRRLPYVPLAWAATLLLAVGLGWYLRGTRGRTVDAFAVQSTPPAPPVVSPTPAAPAALALKEGASQQQTVTNQRRRHDVSAPTPVARESDRASGMVNDTTRLITSPPLPALPAGNAIEQSAAPTAGNPIVPRDEVASKASAADRAAPTSAIQQNVYIDGAPVRNAWGEITADSARALLGGAFATIPGVPISRILSTPGSPTVVWITLALDSGTTVALHEQRAETYQAALATAQAATRGNLSQRQARYVGALRVEISGTVSADSLSRLLELVR